MDGHIEKKICDKCHGKFKADDVKDVSKKIIDPFCELNNSLSYPIKVICLSCYSKFGKCYKCDLICKSKYKFENISVFFCMHHTIPYFHLFKCDQCNRNCTNHKLYACVECFKFFCKFCYKDRRDKKHVICNKCDYKKLRGLHEAFIDDSFLSLLDKVSPVLNRVLQPFLSGEYGEL